MDERDDDLKPEDQTPDKKAKTRANYPAPFSLCLSVAEREQLARFAEDQPWGQYTKGVIFRGSARPRRRGSQPIKDRQLLAKLLGLLGKSRISQNINQLAKAANSGSLPLTPDVHKELVEATRAVQNMRAMLIEAMGLKDQIQEEPLRRRAVILKGSQRSGARQMALHLMNGEQNEHVSAHEIKGFVAGDVLGALNEAYALSKGTKCVQFMYALSLNPPANEEVPCEGLRGRPLTHQGEAGSHGPAARARLPRKGRAPSCPLRVEPDQCGGDEGHQHRVSQAQANGDASFMSFECICSGITIENIVS